MKLFKLLVAGLLFGLCVGLFAVKLGFITEVDWIHLQLIAIFWYTMNYDAFWYGVRLCLNALFLFILVSTVLKIFTKKPSGA